jgi:micrococcal nuclease
MRQKIFIGVAAVIVAVMVWRLGPTTGSYSVAEVFDGDTIAVNMDGVVEKVRLIGIDTPETKDPRKPVQCYGPEASAFTHANLEHKRVKLVADPLSTNRDRYDRLLRYVYVDGVSYNKLLLQKGFARQYTGFPYSKWDTYTAVQNSAKASNTGLWAKCPSV